MQEAKGEDRDDLLAVSQNWLEGRGDRKDWSFVIQALINSGQKSEELLAAGITWLEASKKHPSWPFVWCTLMPAFPAHAPLEDLGHAWLATSPRHRKVGDVRQILSRLDWFRPKNRGKRK